MREQRPRLDARQHLHWLETGGAFEAQLLCYAAGNQVATKMVAARSGTGTPLTLGPSA